MVIWKNCIKRKDVGLFCYLWGSWHQWYGRYLWVFDKELEYFINVWIHSSKNYSTGVHILVWWIINVYPWIISNDWSGIGLLISILIKFITIHLALGWIRVMGEAPYTIHDPFVRICAPIKIKYCKPERIWYD